MDDAGRPYEMVRGRCPRDCIRRVVDEGGRTVGNAGTVGHAGRVRLTRPGSNPTAGRRGRRPLRATATRTLQHTTRRVLFPHASPKVRGRCPRYCIRWTVDARRAHRGKRGCHRSRRPSAPTLPRRSRDHGAPRTVHPTGSSVTGLAAYDATDVENHTQTARPPHGSAKMYPIAQPVGGGVPDAPSVG